MTTKEEAMDAVGKLLSYLEADNQREGLKKTPQRVIESWDEIFSGYKEDAKDILDATFNGEGYDGIVLLRDIEFHSTCEHHLQPFSGRAHVAYIPVDRIVGISKLSSYNLTYDLLIFPRQLPAAIALVEKFPKQIFILDHIAKPNISNSKAENWKKNITVLSKFNNVNCKLSGMVTETEGFIFNDNDFYPYIDHIFKSFGPERILFGSDWPVCLLACLLYTSPSPRDQRGSRMPGCG